MIHHAQLFKIETSVSPLFIHVGTAILTLEAPQPPYAAPMPNIVTSINMTDSTDTTTTDTQNTRGSQPYRPKTAWATDARKAAYDTIVRKALPAIRLAHRKHGVFEGELLAVWLNTQQVPAPNHRAAWNKSSVLRALHRLHELGLHAGPQPRKPRKHPVSLLWPEGRRAVATRKMFARKPS